MSIQASNIEIHQLLSGPEYLSLTKINMLALREQSGQKELNTANTCAFTQARWHSPNSDKYYFEIDQINFDLTH